VGSATLELTASLLAESITMADPRENNLSQPPTPASFITVGERWRRSASQFKQRRRPHQPWSGFAARVQTRHRPLSTKYKGLEARVRAETQPPGGSHPNPLPDEAAALIAAAEAPRADQTDAPTPWSGSSPRPNRAGPLPQATDGGLPPTVERSSHVLLDGRIKQFLAGLLNIRIPTVKLYTGQAANQVTRQHGADALTYGDSILFRSGQYQPREPAGLALLGHELTHVAQTMGQPPPSPVAAHRWPQPEQQALSNEGRVLQHLTRPTPADYSMAPPAPLPRSAPLPHPGRSRVTPSFLAPPVPPPGISRQALTPPMAVGVSPGQTASAPRSAPPMAASSAREVSMPPPTQAAPTPSYPGLTAQQLSQIKDEVYRDLMDRIRIEFERGG
jgi:hypothetical protein